jgi:CheY-like chemotaxis protein
VCESLAAILRDLGHEVRIAHDGLQAVDKATAWMPEFVLLDINMPGLNGYDAARRLRSQFPSSRMRLVMISGADLEPAVLEAARQAGFDECLDKLLDFGALKKLLEG